MQIFATVQRCALAALWCCSACDADDSVSTGNSQVDDDFEPPNDDDGPRSDSGGAPDAPSIAVVDASAANTDAGPASVEPDAAQDSRTDASTEAGVQVEPPLPCVDYTDCPLSLDQTCHEEEGVSTGESALLDCEQGFCRYGPIGQSCSDGSDCDSCRGLGRAQGCRRESGSACTVCCYGILATLRQHDIAPDLQCACAAGSPCADTCGPSTVCAGELEPSLDCLGCLRDAFAAEGTCATSDSEAVGAEVCRSDRLDEELGCSQLGLCLANCPP